MPDYINKIKKGSEGTSVDIQDARIPDVTANSDNNKVVFIDDNQFTFKNILHNTILTGAPETPDLATNTDNSQIANTRFVHDTIESYIDSGLSTTSTNPVQNKVITTALNAKASLANPAFTGTPTAPDIGGATSSRIATKNYVDTAIDNKDVGVTGVKGSSESSYRTGQVNITKANLGLANVENYSRAQILASAALTGTPTAPTPQSNSGATQIATKEYVDNFVPDLSSYMQKGVDYVTAGQLLNSDLGTKATAEGLDTTASGNASHAEGSNTTASGIGAHAEGHDSEASGNYSHAEGQTGTASGNKSHAEGSYSTASGEASHAEGNSTTASSTASHAEGYNTTASGNASHAEGTSTIAQKKSQHVFGEWNVADTAGTDGTTRGNYVEIVGKGTANNARSNARTLDWYGNETLAGKLTVGTAPTANMDVTTKQYVDNKVSSISIPTASDSTPIVDGTGSPGSEMAYSRADHVHPKDSTKADVGHTHNLSNDVSGGILSVSYGGTGQTSIANIRAGKDGDGNTISSTYMKKGTDYVTAGQVTGQTLGTNATAEGYSTTASAEASHAEGWWTQATDIHSHAEGAYTRASGTNSHAEGSGFNNAYLEASGASSHAEGIYTKSSGSASHSEGYYTKATGDYAHAEGNNTTAQRKSQHAFGEYNILDGGGSGVTERGNYIEIVGNGTSNSLRSNARTLDWNGNEVLAGKLTVGTAPTNDMDVATKKYVDDNSGSGGVTYTFTGGTNKFIATPSSGNSQTVTITPSIANNITGSGTSGYIAKFNGANTITNGPAFGSATTTFLRNDGNWAAPVGTTYATCTTAASTAAKTASIIAGTFTLETGSTVFVKFTNTNTASVPTLNINSTGAKSIMRYGTTNVSTTWEGSWRPGAIVCFVYDGTNWVMMTTTENNPVYGSVAAESGGTILSLVTTGEKYTWNNKADKGVVIVEPGTASTDYTKISSAIAADKMVFLKVSDSGVDYSDYLYLPFVGHAPVPMGGGAYQYYYTFTGQYNNKRISKSVSKIGNSFSWSATSVADTPTMSTTTISLTSSGWSGKSQTVTATGVKASNLVQVSPIPSDASSYAAAEIICTAQAANSLTFTCKTVPTDTISVNVVIWG